MKIKLLLIFLVTTYSSFAQQLPIGLFNNAMNSTSYYDEASQTYTIKSVADDGFLYNNIAGDFIATANFSFTDNIEKKGTIGWIAKTSTNKNDLLVKGVVYNDGLTKSISKINKSSTTEEVLATKRFYDIIQLERKGTIFIVRVAHFGEPFQVLDKKKITGMPKSIFLGIATSGKQTAEAWNVRIDQPVNDNYNPNTEGWLGCRMETMNVFTGKRSVVYEKNNRFEAPNWMPNGKELLFNMDGLLYTIPSKGGAVKKLNTGSADELNNDHCISFNGKMLGISHNNGNGSNVFVLPLSGGEPKPVTTVAPSYLHGWSPNNKEVVYVAQRNASDRYNIYKKPVNGGQEMKLTNTKKWEHVDGCEYSPDGKYIYYNASVHGGTMQLWRMEPDGSHKEQLTFDEYNNWFPHISPDGKWIAFISFEPTISLNAHPSYKRVMLRLMSTTGGAPKTIAYLYGGQGTINVNSWSPDSKHIAFVSNTK